MDRESLDFFYFLNMTLDFLITEEFKRKVDNILDLGVGSLRPSLFSQNGLIGAFFWLVASVLYYDWTREFRSNFLSKSCCDSIGSRSNC
jgi:hypothetical protein